MAAKKTVETQTAEKKTVEKKIEEKMNVDEALERLDEINQKLSDKDIALDEAVELYKEGIRVATQCKEVLTGVEKTLEIIHA